MRRATALAVPARKMS